MSAANVISTLQLPLLLPTGPDCERCVGRLQSGLAQLKGVEGASVDRARGAMEVAYNPDLVTVSRIEEQARRIGAELAATIEHQSLDLRDLDCPDCAASIEKDVRRLPGVLWAGANFAAGQLYVEFERGATALKDICRVVEGHGVRACALPGADRIPNTEHRTPNTWIESYRRSLTTTACFALLAAGYLLHDPAAVALLAAAILAGGWSTARSAFMALRARALDMNVLMTVAVVGAAGIGDWHEAAAVVALFNLGNLLQAGAMERTRRSIRGLMDLSPKQARVVRDGAETDIPVERVIVGDRVLVRPGERIPVDGDILAGSSAVNEAPITGESLPREKAAGDAVFAGTLNGRGALEVRATRAYRDTTLARIIHRVEEAQAQRAPAQQLIDRFARVYTPLVVGIAALVAGVPPLAQIATSGAHAASVAWGESFPRALALLIIACPCALVISTPVAIVTAIGSAARRGALVKGGAFLEELGRLRALLYDKTGTLTTGAFRVEEVVPLDGMSAERVLAVAAAIEARSEHPLAAAFEQADQDASGHARLRVEHFAAAPGLGARATVDGRPYLIGSLALFRGEGVALDGAASRAAALEQAGKTVVALGTPERVLGLIALADTPRADLRETVKRLRALGVARQTMLTGDNPHVARAIGEAAGLDAVRASLLPEDKLRIVRETQANEGPVGMVGDGINDAPALAAANVGIVMGAAGSDTAIETADVALMRSDLGQLPWLVALSRRARAIIRQNIAFSLATKLALLAAAITVGLPLWLAVVGDVGVSLLVTLNALRLRS